MEKLLFFFTLLKKRTQIDAELLEGISKINKIDYWIVRFDGADEDIHARAVGIDPDFIEDPEMIWSLEAFEKDNF